MNSGWVFRVVMGWGATQMKGKINSIYHGSETSSLLIKDVRT